MHNQTTYIAALFAATTAMAACTAKLPTADIALTTGASLLLSGANSNVVSGRPRTVYERVARQASRCWFGPFGSAHSRYIMHADVPPPTSSAPVTMAVHRRLNSRKKPWGPALLRLELNGNSSTTTISYINSGLNPGTFNRMTSGFTRWANGRKDCTPVHGTKPRWVPLNASTPSGPAARR